MTDTLDLLDTVPTADVRPARRLRRPSLTSEPRPADLPGWWRRLADRIVAARIETWISLLVVGAGVVYVLVTVHPELIVANTTPAGGDMGAHVWAPAYLRDHLLPHLRLSGWTPDWYAGFPLYTFYMLPPALLVVLLDVVLPYGIALKMVTVLGVLTLPVCAYWMGKLAGMRFPVPPLLSVGAVLFLFDTKNRIYGGTIASTMAGEFSFSIALSVAVLYIGVLAYFLRTGRRGGWVAVLLALAVLCHLLVGIFAMVATVVLFLLYASRKRFTALASLGACGMAMTLFWLLPFWERRDFMTDMKYEKLHTYADLVFPNSFRVDVLLAVLAGIGLLGSVVRGRRFGVFLGVMALGYGAMVVLLPQGQYWNPRLTPFLGICRFLLVAIGASEVVLQVAALARRRWQRRGERAMLLTAPVAAIVFVICLLLVQFWDMPGGSTRTVTKDGKTEWSFHWGPFVLKKQGFVDGWAKWNYSGYERKSAYREYHDLMATMKDIGVQRGCGRAEWEYTEKQDRYGTTMALMLLPFWTDGCIGSMEGLYFEASGTTPYHFLVNAALSEKPSKPVRKLNYDTLDVAKGTQQMQVLGVRYYMAFSDAAKAQADAVADLTPIGESGPWKVYEVASSDIVQPLRYRPVVVPDAGSSRDSWLDVAVDWFMHPEQWDVMKADAGPADWTRVPLRTGAERAANGQNGDGTTLVSVDKVPLDAVSVTAVNVGRDEISFDVDKVGVPVLVKASYFPNWTVEGGKGPYRVAPNAMLVIPTDKHVTVRYARSGVELLGMGLSLIGLLALVVLVRRGPVTFPSSRPEPTLLPFDTFDESDLLDATVPFDLTAILAGPDAVLGADDERFPTDIGVFDDLLGSDESDPTPVPESVDVAMDTASDGREEQISTRSSDIEGTPPL